MRSTAIVPHQPVANLDILKADPSAIGRKIYEQLPKFQRTIIETFVSIELKKTQPGVEMGHDRVRDAIHRQIGDPVKARLVLERLLGVYLPDSPVYLKYQKLGSALPGSDLLKATKKVLSPIFHEAKTVGNIELTKKYQGIMAQVQQSITYLGKSEYCTLYNQIVPVIEKLSGKGKITDIFDEVLGKNKSGAATANEGAFAKIAKKINGAKPEAKLAMLAGASVVVGLVAYGISKINKDKEKDAPAQGFADKEDERRASRNSGNISAQVVA